MNSLAVRSFEVAGTPIPLRDPNPDYELWIAEAKAEAQSTAQDQWLITPYRSPHAGYWTGDIGLQWNHRENQELRRIRDATLRTLSHGPLLDLGCGTPENVRHMQAFLEPYRPQAYVGVDILAEREDRPSKDIDEFGTVAQLSKRAGDVLPGALIRGDMLEVLSQLPDDSMHSVTLNGVDHPVVHHETRYGRATAAEIQRVVRRGGLVWGVALTSGLLSHLVDTHNFHGNYVSMPLRITHPREAAIRRWLGSDGAGYYFLIKD